MTLMLARPHGGLVDNYPEQVIFLEEDAPPAAGFTGDRPVRQESVCPSPRPDEDDLAAGFTRVRPQQSVPPVPLSEAPRPAPDQAAFREWLLPSVTLLLELQHLPHGWDNCGSPTIDNRALLSAASILIRAYGTGVPVPRIAPVTGGGVKLRWERGGRKLEVVCRTGGRCVYLKSDTGGTVEGSAAADGAKDLMRWLLGTLPVTQAHSPPLATVSGPDFVDEVIAPFLAPPTRIVRAKVNRVGAPPLPPDVPAEADFLDE